MQQETPPPFDPEKVDRIRDNTISNPSVGQYIPTEKPKKKGKLDIDDEYDFIFLKNCSPILRWLLVLPMGLLGLFLVQFAYGFIVESLLRSFNGSDTLRVILNVIFTLLEFIVMMTSMVATVPVRNKTKAAVILSIIPILFMCIIVWITKQPETLERYEFMQYEAYILFAAAMIGTAVGVWNVKRSMSELKQK